MTQHMILSIYEEGRCTQYINISGQKTHKNWNMRGKIFDICGIIIKERKIHLGSKNTWIYAEYWYKRTSCYAGRLLCYLIQKKCRVFLHRYRGVIALSEIVIGGYYCTNLNVLSHLNLCLVALGCRLMMSRHHVMSWMLVMWTPCTSQQDAPAQFEWPQRPSDG